MNRKKKIWSGLVLYEILTKYLIYELLCNMIAVNDVDMYLYLLFQNLKIKKFKNKKFQELKI